MLLNIEKLELLTDDELIHHCKNNLIKDEIWPQYIIDRLISIIEKHSTK